MSLTGKVCLVTGGTRGIGRGIAVQLGEAGATVYVTGRTLKAKQGAPGSLEATQKDIEARGGVCIPVVCDHGNDEEVRALFDQINREQDGRLDILVNNAYAGVTVLMNNIGVPFWEHKDTTWDLINNVGLRNHYLCTVYASRMMVPRKQGLIVNVSSVGGLRYLFNVPYGVGKAAMDRMAADCAIELRKHKVTMVSLWPGAVKTELLTGESGVNTIKGEYFQPGVGKIDAKKIQESFDKGESTEYPGMCIVHLAQDSQLLNKSGRILLSGELGAEYGFTDIDGQVIPSPRSVNFLLKMAGWKKTASLFPKSLKIPYFFMTMAGSKF